TWHGDVSVIWNERSRLDFGALVRRQGQDGATNQFVYAPALIQTQDAAHGAGHQAGAYVQESFGPSSKVHFTFGLRQDAHSESRVQLTSPYASVWLQPWTKTRVELDWGQYGQFPELNQYLSTFVHGSLLPQRATHYEATLEQRLSDRMRVRLEFYDRQDRDL